VNAEQAPKQLMCKPIPPSGGEGWYGKTGIERPEVFPLHRGIGGGMSGKRRGIATREVPAVRACAPQPAAREGMSRAGWDDGQARSTREAA
jgi:hypothetical protein